MFNKHESYLINGLIGKKYSVAKETMLCKSTLIAYNSIYMLLKNKTKFHQIVAEFIVK